jgi:hypothetical protein
VTRDATAAWVGVGVLVVVVLALGGAAAAQSSGGTLTVDGGLDVSVATAAPAGSPFDAPVSGPGATGVPTDPDGDGRYEDVNGDGEATLEDVFALAFGPVQRPGDLSEARTAALDFDGDGALTLEDAFALAFGG